METQELAIKKECLAKIGKVLYDNEQFEWADDRDWTKIQAIPYDNIPLIIFQLIIRKYKDSVFKFLPEADKASFDNFWDLLGLNEPTLIGLTVFLPYLDYNNRLRVPIFGLINQEFFPLYVQTQKDHGLKFDSDKKEWFLPATTSLNIDSYIYKMNQLKLVPACEIAPEVASRKNAPKRIIDVFNTDIDELIDCINACEVSDTIVLKCHHNGLFSFYCTFSEIFNELFSNRTGRLTGITEYNERSHGRETYDIALCEEAIEKLKEFLPNHKLVIDKNFAIAQKRRDEYNEELKKPIPEVVAKLADDVRLYPYQNEGVRFLETNDGCALIGDEMGLGKTIQALAWVAVHNKKCLVIAPKVVRRNWVNEALRFFPKYFNDENSIEIRTKYLNDNDFSLDGLNIAVINYESLNKLIPFLNYQFDTLIIDESHRIKEPKAQITRTIQSIAEQFKHKILLSGTAVKNKKEELLNQLELVRPGMFTKEELRYGTIGGVWNKMRPLYIARQKSQVLPDLPEKVTSIAEIDGSQLPTNYPQCIGEMSAFKATMAIAKAPLTIAFCKEMLESSDSNLLIFTDSVDAAKLIAEGIGDSAILHHGQLCDNEREFIKDAFQNHERYRVLVSTRQSLAVGANLTRADKVIFNDLPWTAADVRQAEDRTHRIGQLNKVNVYWITGTGNLWDEKISDLVLSKYALCKAVNEGKQITPEERKWMDKPLSLDEILGELRKPKKPRKKWYNKKKISATENYEIGITEPGLGLEPNEKNVIII